jgi:hypothetical protein
MRIKSVSIKIARNIKNNALHALATLSRCEDASAARFLQATPSYVKVAADFTHKFKSFGIVLITVM